MIRHVRVFFFFFFFLISLSQYFALGYTRVFLFACYLYPCLFCISLGGIELFPAFVLFPYFLQDFPQRQWGFNWPFGLASVRIYDGDRVDFCVYIDLHGMAEPQLNP